MSEIQAMNQTQRSPANQNSAKHAVFYTSRTSIMSPFLKNPKLIQSHSNSQSKHLKVDAQALLTSKVSAIGQSLPQSNLSHKESGKGNKCNKSECKTNAQESNLLKNSLSLIKETIQIKDLYKKSYKYNTTVHKIINDYKKTVQHSHKEKRKRKQRIHANNRSKDINETKQTPRRKIIKLITSQNACHLAPATEQPQTLCNVNEIKYEGKTDHQDGNHKNWRVSNAIHHSNFRKKKAGRHHSEDRNLTKLIERDDLLLEKLNFFHKEIQMIRSGKMETNNFIMTKRQPIRQIPEVSERVAIIEKKTHQGKKIMPKPPHKTTIKFRPAINYQKTYHKLAEKQKEECQNLTVDAWNFHTQEDQDEQISHFSNQQLKF